MAVTAKPERAADSAAALVETPAIRTRFIRRIPEGACVDVRKRGTALFRPHDHQKGAVPLFGMRQARRLLGLTFSCESEARSRSGRRDHVQMIEHRPACLTDAQRLDE